MKRRRGSHHEGHKGHEGGFLSAALRLCAGICLLASTVLAQIPDPPDNFVTEDNSTGVAAFTSYTGLRENINLSNLNLNIVIPLITLRGRNGLDVEVVAHYNSIQREWVETTSGPLGETTCKLEGISEAGAREFDIQIEPRLTYEPGELSSTTPFPRRHRYVLREPDGTRHELRLRDNDAEEYNQNNWELPGRFRSTGSSHLSLQEFLQPDGAYDAALYLPDGRQILFEPAFAGRGNQQAQAIRDSNGNQVTFEWSAGQVTRLVDTLGREVRYSFDFPSGTTTVEVDASSGQTLTWVLTETELTLPNGLSWRFEWDFEGPFTDPCEASQSRTDKRLARIYYPSGGSTRYEWTVPPLPNNIKTLLHKKHTCDRTDGLACTTAQEETTTYVLDSPSGFTQVTRADGTYSRHHFIPFALLNDEMKEILTERFSETGVLLGSVEQDWDIYGRDPKVIEVREKLHDTGGAPLVKRRVMVYDEHGYARPGRDLSTGNLVRLEEYAWGETAAGPLLRRTENAYLVNAAYGVESSTYILDRLTQTQIFDGSGELASQTGLFYDEYTAIGSFSRNLISVSPIQHDAGYSAFFLTRGNLSRRVDWLSTGEGDPVTLYRYDTAGNLRRVRDPKSNVSITDYSPATEFAYPSSTTNALGHVESFQYDYNAVFDRGFGGLTSRTDPNGRTTTTARDILGRVIRVDYPDGGVERRYFSDLQASAVHHQTGAPVFPEQAPLPLRAKTYTRIADSPFLEREAFEVADGLARLSLSGLRNGPDMDWMQTLYDGNERVWQLSNPLSAAYGSGNVPSLSFASWTVTSYDALDRAVEVETPDGQSAATAYSGNRATVTDQAGASRRSATDALGRIVEVREPDPATGSLDSGDFTDTLYSYDLLDNLTSVLQGAGANDQDGGGGGPPQARSFLYDSLGRLIQESHPESGTTHYAYDANGNLLEKADTRGRRIENDFDALNRIVSTSYSLEGDPSRTDPTPPVSYFYDGSTALNRKGRLRSVTDGTGSSTFEYDSMGRTVRSVRTTRGKTLTADYAYTFLGGVKTASYQGVSPSGFTLAYTYDSQGRQNTLSDGGGNPFITGYGFDYGLTDALEQTHFANGTIEAVEFNNRLQPQRRIVYDPSFNALMDQFYFFDKPGGGGNNGNIWEIADFLAFQSRHFSYDQLNRLTGVNGSGWSISYSYDRFGNRLSALGTGSPPGFQGVSLSIDPSTNRIASPGWEYDDAGNAIEDGGGHHFLWDSAGRLVEMGPPQPSSSGPPGDDGRCTVPPCPPPPPPPPDPPPPLDDGRSSLPPGLKAQSAGTMLYEYDYQDRRVVKDEGGSGRIYFWDEVFGEVIWEFPLEAPANQDVVRGFFNGRLVVENDARPGAGLHFMHRDHLGTSKLMTDFFSPTVVCDEVYHPFGQIQSGQPAGCNAHVRKFTGKERDEESGMDYFGARYSDSLLGRFISPDPLPASGRAGNPQTWNRYVYVLNNPLRFVDPLGLMEVPQECADDANCTIVVQVNVIFDKDVNGGKGLTTAQKDAIKKEQLENAKASFANSNIQLEFSFTQGTQSGKNPPTGIKKDAVNIFVSNRTPTGTPAASGLVKGTDIPLVILDFRKVQDDGFFTTNSTKHEFGHVTAGDVFKKRPRGLEGFFINFGNERAIDSRLGAQNEGASVREFRQGLVPRRFAVPLKQKDNKPRP